MASVFPQAAACFETIVGDIQIPDHPLVREVMRDVLQEAMDLEGLLGVLRGIADGSVRCLAVDTPVPSQFAHELLNANPYAFLDEAGLEERRARAVSLEKGIPASVIVEDQEAMNTVENACNSVQLMESRGWTSAEVISSASHLPRAAMIFSRLPVEWRVHAAPEPGLAGGGTSAAGTALEILKTVHYLVWSRQTEPCAL